MESENESKSEEHEQNPTPGRKPYERHTQRQKRKLEEYFAVSQHPDEKDRLKISEETGLDPARVKFWFQNKRTQTKNKEMRGVNEELKAEVEKLRSHIEVYENALRTAVCPNCGWPSLGDLTLDHQLRRLENDQLREEPTLDQAGPSNRSIPSFGPQPDTRSEIFVAAGNNDDFGGDRDGTYHRALLFGIAEDAANELQVMAEFGEPLWLPAGPDNSTEILNEEEYSCKVAKWTIPNSFGLKREATRASAMVNMSVCNLVEILNDAKKWSILFSGIVLRATTMEVHSRGRNYNGALQVISAEYQLPSPLVPTRECSFLRYCKNLPENKSWVIVDVSLETSHANPVNRCLRRPSGCLICEMEDRSLKIIWVEHFELDDKSVHVMYKPIINSGIAFGAKRWIATLDRQCDRLARVINCNVPDGSEDERESRTRTEINVLKLAERMVISFYAGVAASVAHGWVNEYGTGANDVRIASKRNVSDPSMPCGITLNASVSLWLPAVPKRIFDFLSDENYRAKWDTLSENGTVAVASQIPTGTEHGPRISLLHLNENKKMMFIQESCFDETCSYIIYAPLSMRAMNMCMYGGDPGRIHLLPAGFSVVPDGPSWMSTNGSLLTASFQILADSNPQSDISPESAEAVKTLVMTVVDNIKNEILGDSS